MAEPRVGPPVNQSAMFMEGLHVLVEKKSWLGPVAAPRSPLSCWTESSDTGATYYEQQSTSSQGPATLSQGQPRGNQFPSNWLELQPRASLIAFEL